MQIKVTEVTVEISGEVSGTLKAGRLLKDVGVNAPETSTFEIDRKRAEEDNEDFKVFFDSGLAEEAVHFVRRTTGTQPFQLIIRIHH